MRTMRPSSGYGRGRSSTPSTTEKIAVVAPMPSASVRMAARVKTGCFLNTRAVYRRSCHTSRSACPVVAPGVIGAGTCACRSDAMQRASRFPSLNSASARRVASSSDAPPDISSRQRSSRCCESSSTISCSRVGERRSDDKRGRTWPAQSGKFVSRHASYRLDECRPGLPLLGEEALSLRRQLVEPAAAFVGLLDPGALDPAALFEAIEQGVEGVDVELQLTARPGLDQLAQVVAVPRARVEQREDEQLRRSAFQFTVERPRVDS